MNMPNDLRISWVVWLILAVPVLSPFIVNALGGQASCALWAIAGCTVGYVGRAVYEVLIFQDLERKASDG